MPGLGARSRSRGDARGWGYAGERILRTNGRALTYSTLPLVRLRIIDEQSERGGRPIVNCAGLLRASRRSRKPLWVRQVRSNFGRGLRAEGRKRSLQVCVRRSERAAGGAADLRRIGRHDPRRFGRTAGSWGPDSAGTREAKTS